MKNVKNYCWMFTLVNRFSLERVDGVFVFAPNLVFATRKVRKLFFVSLYDVETAHIVENSSLVIVGYSNYDDLKSFSHED